MSHVNSFPRDALGLVNHVEQGDKSYWLIVKAGTERVLHLSQVSERNSFLYCDIIIPCVVRWYNLMISMSSFTMGHPLTLTIQAANIDISVLSWINPMITYSHSLWIELSFKYQHVYNSTVVIFHVFQLFRLSKYIHLFAFPKNIKK